MPETNIVPSGAFIQVCHVVDNLEAACARYNRLFGMGPFIGGGNGVLDNHVYRGQPAEPIRIRGVFVQSGDLNIELVELVSAGPSAFHDMYPDGGQGIHHMAMFCEDYEGTRDRYVAAGMPVASEFTVSFGAQICYIDARATMGHMIELYPESEIIRGMYARARQESENWDGKQLIIPW